MPISNESSRDFLTGSVVARWVLRRLQRFTARWQATVNALVGRSGVTDSLRALYERPLRACGEALIIAVLTHLGWWTLWGAAISRPKVAISIGWLFVGLAACASPSDWPAVLASSRVAQWWIRRMAERH